MIYPVQPHNKLCNIITIEQLNFLGKFHAWAGFPTLASAAWPAASRALYLPFYLEQHLSVGALGIYNGATAANNHELAIYNGRTLAQIVTTGSVAGGGNVNTIQKSTISTTILAPGFYFYGLSLDTITDTTIRYNSSVLSLIGIGVRQEAAAFPLPATATPAAPASAYCPFVVIYGDSFV